VGAGSELEVLCEQPAIAQIASSERADLMGNLLSHA
jgi:hypothetical protein